MREFRGKNIENHQFVYGYYSACIEKGDNGGVGVYYKETQTPIHYISDENNNMYIVYTDTVGRYAGVRNENGVKVFKGDKVKFLGIEGEVCFECGSFGIGIESGINYDIIQRGMDNSYACCNNKYTGCLNDNFISFWEIIWNFNYEDGIIDELEILGTIYDEEG